MKFPCEIVVRDYLPVVRAAMARELSEHYKLKQSQIASLLGVTQASISHYLSAKRGYSLQLSKRHSDLAMMGKKLAKALVEGTSSMQVIATVCNLCKNLRVNDVICELHKKAFTVLKDTTCDICK